MRIGVISDIHSNIDALRAVFQEFQERNIDKIICLGDIIGLGAHPEECVQLMMEHQNQILALVHGNHENYLLNTLPTHNHNDENQEILPPEIIELFKWNHGQISNTSINFLKQFTRQQVVEVEGSKIYVSHYPLDQLGNYRKFYFRPDSTQCKQIFKNIDADIFLFGHTHIRCTIKTHDGKLYINPGSVGCPIGIEAASVGILEILSNNVSYEQIDITYDVDHAINEMLGFSEKYPTINYTVNRYYRILDN